MTSQRDNNDVATDKDSGNPPLDLGIDLDETCAQVAPTRREINLGLNVAKERASDPVEIAKKRTESAINLQVRMKELGDLAGHGSTLHEIAKQIAEQQRILDIIEPFERAKQIAKQRRAADDMKSFWVDYPDRLISSHVDPAGAREPDIAANPIQNLIERRFKRQEERSEQMLDFATDAMKIVTGLQGAVAELLLTVEKAASDSARAERRAIWISVTAVIVAVAMTTVQMAYSEFQREPSNAVRRRPHSMPCDPRSLL